MSIGKNILKFRTDRGLTQKNFSNMCGFSQAALNLWENEKRKPKMEQIKKIADTFQCDVSDIMEYGSNISATKKTETEHKDRLPENITSLPGNLMINITKENYEKYTKYFNVAFSTIKEIICNETNTKMIYIETGKELERKDIEKIFDSLSIEKKLELFQELVKNFIINPIFDAINIDLR